MAFQDNPKVLHPALQTSYDDLIARFALVQSTINNTVNNAIVPKSGTNISVAADGTVNSTFVPKSGANITVNVDGTIDAAVVSDYRYLSTLPTGNWVVTDSAFVLSSTVAGTTYVVTRNIDLAGATVTLAKNVALVFNGGKISNGTLNGVTAYISAQTTNIFGSVALTGTWRNRTFVPEWWGDNTNTTATYDWQPSLQAALNAAALGGAIVELSPFVYRYYGGLTVAAGVTISGAGHGDTVLGSGPTKSSVLFNVAASLSGTATSNVALRVMGSMVKLYDFCLKGSQKGTDPSHGLQFYGIGTPSQSYVGNIENCVTRNVLVHGFLGSGANGVHLLAGNAGSVTYSQFYNLRTRNCSTHLKIESLSAKPSINNLDNAGVAYASTTGFLNSNSFFGFFASGYADTGIWMRSEPDAAQVNSQDVYRPCNNMLFYHVIIEPPYSQYGHIKLEGTGTQARMFAIRVEAAQQDTKYPNVPVIYLGPGTNGVLVDGDQTNISIQDLGYNNTIAQRSVKNANPSPNSTNLWKNAAFVGLINDGTTWSLPEWTIEEQCIDPNGTYAWRPLQVNSAITLAYDTDQMRADYKSLAFVVPPAYQLRITQALDRTTYGLTHAKVNAYVKTATSKGVTFTYQDQVTPIVATGAAFGSGVWEPVGGLLPITNVTLSPSYYRIALFVQNAIASTSSTSFSVCRPVFVTGDTITADSARFLKDNGANMYGVFSQNQVYNISPTNNANHRVGTDATNIVLPVEGNYFEIIDPFCQIVRVNYNNPKFPAGTDITLSFPNGNATMVSGTFLTLSKDFAGDANSTITLRSPKGNGLWVEVSRSSKREMGVTTVDLSATVIDVASPAFHALPVDGSTEYVVTNTAGGTYGISRLNNVTRMPAGKRIRVKFSSPGTTVQVINGGVGGYISLAKTGNYTPVDGDWLELVTAGTGTWEEVNRKQSSQPLATKGAANIDTGTASVYTSPILTVPTTGENYITLNNTSATAASIQRINDAASVRLAAGTQITLNFGTLTSAVNLVPSSYLVLSQSGTYAPVTGDWMTLTTDGNGVWRELARKQLALPVQTKGLATVVVSSSNLVSGVLATPLTGENFFRIDCTSVGGNVTRINSNVRMAAGTTIVLKFTNVTTAVKLVNSGYISLAGAADFTPAVNNMIGLITAGDGTWEELYRRTT